MISALDNLVTLVIVPPGSGYLQGTTEFAGSPGAPAQARVQLFLSSNAHGQAFPTSTFVDWRLTGADGIYRFDGLDPALKYNLIAYDHTGQYDPVIKLNLTPTVD